jgi:L-seryl-tRNA(Ser) seleniumtransferase
VADRLHAILSNPPRIANPPVSAAPPAGLAGQWDVEISFSLGTAKHSLSIEQEGKRLVGTHRGETLAGDLTGSVNGNDVRFRSSHKIEGTRLGYNFTGSLKGDTLEGTVEMGEYGEAKWKAVRHTYRTPGGIVRPVKNGQSAAE